jgi:hypothetical protein
MEELLKQMEQVKERFTSMIAADQQRAVETMDAIIASTKNLVAEFSSIKTLADPNLMMAEVIKLSPGSKHHLAIISAKTVDIRIDSYNVNELRDLPALPGKIVVLYYKEDK